MNPHTLHRGLLFLVVVLSSATSSLAQENQELGRMWTFENPPLAYLEKEYGFKPDEKWLNSLRLGSLRLGGDTQGFCSASFVSPQGLIMTNNHCVRDAVSASRQDGPQLVKSGYYATSLDKEIRLRTQGDGPLRVSQLEQITNVTDRVNEGITDADGEAKIKEKREANKKKILAEAKEKSPKLDSQIVSLYQGGIFQLYQYKIWNDLRLVCTPHLQIAHFGGDPDNFTYPRYSVDFAFVRAYEDGKPADTTKHYFKWKMGGAKSGELVFVPGNPGSTERLNTKAQMEFLRDVKQPITLQMYTNQLTILRKVAKRSPRLADVLRTAILGYENSQKAITGELGGLRDTELMAQKAKAEAAFKARAMKDPELREKYGDLWDRIEKLAADRRVNEPLSTFQTPGGLGILEAALHIVRAFDPDEKEDSRKELKDELGGLAPRDNIITRDFFIDHVGRAQKWLAKDDAYLTKVLGGEPSAKKVFDNMVKSRISGRGFAAYRGELEEGGWEAIQKSEDTAIVAARALAPLVRHHEAQQKELDAREESLGALMGRALFACYGTNVSPDATMTPRFSDGRVEGFPFNGTIAPFRTSYYGLYARNAEFDGEHPFDLPKAWLDRRDKIDMTKSVNFVSTNDIVGGNSGSVVVNKELEVVGLIFDGNIESLPNSYVFKDDVPRSVSVHVDGIIEAMLKIYDAERVVKELQGQ